MDAAPTPLSPAAIAKAVNEPNKELIWRIVKRIGAERATAFLAEALRIEAEGGMLVEDQSRRRTPGGVFFALVRQGVTRKERYHIFTGTQEGQRRPPSPVTSPSTWDDIQMGLVALTTLTTSLVSEATVKLT